MSAESVGRVVTDFLQNHPKVGVLLALLILLHFILSGLHTLRLLGEWLLLTIKFLKHEIRAGIELGQRFIREFTTWDTDATDGPHVTGPRAVVPDADVNQRRNEPPGVSRSPCGGTLMPDERVDQRDGTLAPGS